MSREHKDAHEDDLRALPLTPRELDVCLDALKRARERDCMGIYTAMVGTMISMAARLGSVEIMATDLSALSCEGLTRSIEAATTHELYVPLRNEIVRRLRADGARIAELEAERTAIGDELGHWDEPEETRGTLLDRLYEHTSWSRHAIDELSRAKPTHAATRHPPEPANSKAEDAPIAVGDRVRLRNGTEHVVAHVLVDGWIDLVGQRSIPASLVTRLPPEPAKSASEQVKATWGSGPGTTPLSEPVSGRREERALGWRSNANPAEPSPLRPILDDARRRATVGAPWPSSLKPGERPRPVESAVVRHDDVNTNWPLGKLASDSDDEPILDWLAKRRSKVPAAIAADGKPPADYERTYGERFPRNLSDLIAHHRDHTLVAVATHLQSVLAGVERVAECLERDKSYPMARMAAAELRGVLK